MRELATAPNTERAGASGDFITLGDERFYAIHNVDAMDPFFISVISNADHWLFVSTGGLTAGRTSPEFALFPYKPVDQVDESLGHTGPRTIVRIADRREQHVWEPFAPQRSDRYETTRNLYKNSLGNKLCFEEINHSLQLAFRYTWAMSDTYGFVRLCDIENRGRTDRRIEYLDGLQNVLPAGTPRTTQTIASNLVDAYKWTELDAATGLGLFTLYAAVTDRAAPCESLRANVVYALGAHRPITLLSSAQVACFRAGAQVTGEQQVRGMRGAYFISEAVDIAAGATHSWMLVADVEKSQEQVVALRQELADPVGLRQAIVSTIDHGSLALARIMARADGFQSVAEEIVSCHHYANVLFNVMRGGTIDDQYNIWVVDLARTIRHFNAVVYDRSADFFSKLGETVSRAELLAAAADSGDAQLERLCLEYLPVTFGRRHGDPSRPWNHFSIKLRDETGHPLLSYEGNWRDIFQNWEALAWSYPEFIEGMIAKFVNASTADGHNPYRITKQGIDWEVEERDDPWSYIGYWGDHQIIYLLKLLETSHHFHPRRLGDLLHRRIFCYAQVPYRIATFDRILENPKATVAFDHALAADIERRVAERGADAKLLHDAAGDVYLVSLLEKLLVTLLAKLGNLVVGGGIWLNTQRPEWNDANNALVGNGLSMVTLCYMRRYVSFLQAMLEDETEPFDLSSEVAQWMADTAAGLEAFDLHADAVDDATRFRHLSRIGKASSAYREAIYDHGFSRGTTAVDVADVRRLLDDALEVIDFSIALNKRKDGLYHAYNLLKLDGEKVHIDHLYPMLEGQVAVLSSGFLAPAAVTEVVEALFASAIYRQDQDTFMLYPDRELPGFLEKNRIPESRVAEIPLLADLLAAGDNRIVARDADGCYRFNAELTNADALDARLDAMQADYGAILDEAREPLRRLYEEVFRHHAFTGRSGTMFGFEGLGCIYWHMVSKLLLAVQENFFAAIDAGADAGICRKLAETYYRIRGGLGFNKSPEEYGAFPADPYSHTPGHSGAQQPGMTGQVKEEVLTRFGELGARVTGGAVRFQPALLRPREFSAQGRTFEYLGVDDQWHSIDLAAQSLAFTWCQVPIVYELGDSSGITVTYRDGSRQDYVDLGLTADDSAKLFGRSGLISRIDVRMAVELLAADT
jgi:hypothetical protein